MDSCSCKLPTAVVVVDQQTAYRMIDQLGVLLTVTAHVHISYLAVRAAAIAAAARYPVKT